MYMYMKPTNYYQYFLLTVFVNVLLKNGVFKKILTKKLNEQLFICRLLCTYMGLSRKDIHRVDC